MKTSLFSYAWLAAMLLHGAAAELDEKSARYHSMLLKKPESAAVLTRLIDSWLEQSDQEKLAEILVEKTKSGTAADWRVLAAFHEFSGNDDAALTALNAAVEAAADDKETRLARAKLLGKLLLFDRALADLNEAINDPKLALEATTLSGRYLARAGQPEKAVEAWSKLIAAHPEDVGLQEDLLDLLIEENLMEQAIATSQKLSASTKDPYQKAIRRLRTAQIYSLSNKKTEAANEYQEILTQSAQDSWLERETLAQAQKLFTAQDDSEGWKKFLLTATDTAPKRTALQQQMAAHLIATGDADGAIAVYRNLIQTNPGLRSFRDALIVIFEQAGKTKDAATELKSLLDQNPQDAALWEKMATLQQQLGDQPATAKAVNQSAALLANDEAGIIQKAQLYLRFQYTESCLLLLRSAANQYGALSEAADNLAVYLATHDKADEAVTLWMSAAKTADRESLLRISRSLAAHGKFNEAFQVITEREKDFAEDSLVLTSLCQAAQLTEKSAQAVPAALKLVKLATVATDIENAVKVATSLILRAEKSEDVIQQLTEQQKASVGELCLLAELHELSGDTLQSEKTLTAAAEQDQTLAAAAMRINLLESRGDLPAAITAMRDLIGQPGGTKPHFLQRLVQLLQQNGDTPAALIEVARWKTIAPGDKAAWLKHAELFTELGEPDKAITELRRACAKFGNDEDMREKLLSAQLEAGATNEALRILIQLHDETDSTAKKIKYAGQLASTATMEGTAAELEQQFRKRCRDNPTAIAPLLALREMMITWQKPDEAAELLLEASRRKPEDQDLQSQIAEQWESDGAMERAESLLLELANKYKTDDSKRRLAAFYLRNGNNDKADVIAKELALQAKDARQLELIASAMMTNNQYLQAEQVLRTAATKFPQDWRISYMLAYALELNDKTDEAFATFVSLSHVEQEIPNFVAPTKPKNYGYNSYNPYINPYFQQRDSEVTKSAAFQLQQFTNEIRLAYMQVDQNRYNGNPFASYSGNQALLMLELPEKAATLRSYALIHALSITKKGDKTLTANRLTQLTSSELPFWNAFKQITLVENPTEFLSLLQQQPVDPYVAQIIANYNLLRTLAQDAVNSSQITNDAWKKAAALLSEKYPTFAYDALSRAYSINDTVKYSSEEWQQFIALLERIPAKERSSRMGLIQSTKNTKEKLQLLPAQQEKIDQLIGETEEFFLKDDRYQMQKLAKSLQEMASKGDFVNAAEIANQYIRLMEKMKVKGQAVMPYMRGYAMAPDTFYQRLFSTTPVPLNPNDLIRSFGYENLMSSAMSSGVTFIQAYLPGNRQMESKPNAKQLELIKALNITEKAESDISAPHKLVITDPKIFLEAIMKLERPLDRVLALYACQQFETLDAILAQSLTPESAPDARMLIWASCYQGTEKKDLPLAYALAERARAIATKDQRSAIDTQLVSLGLQLLKDDNAKIDLTAAKSALLRISKSISQAEQKKQLTAKLQAFGLNEAAERLSRPTPVRTASSRSRGGSLASNNTQRSMQDASAMARKGNRAGAARKIYQQARQIIQQQSGNVSYYLRPLIATVKTAKLEKDIIELMQPPATASLRQQLEFYQIICSLTPASTQLAALEKLYQQNPTDPTVLRLLCQAAGAERQLELAKEFQRLTPQELIFFGNQFLEDLNQNDSSEQNAKSLEQYFARIDFISAILDSVSLEKGKARNFSWANNIATNLLQTKYVDGKTLRSLQAPAAIAPYKPDHPLAIKRDACAHRLALAMLKHDSTRLSGFNILKLGQEKFQLDEDALSEIALENFKNNLRAFKIKKENPRKITALLPSTMIGRSYEDDYFDDSDAIPQALNKYLENIAQKTAIDRETLLSCLQKEPREEVEQWLEFLAKPTAEEAKLRNAAILKNPRLLDTALTIARLTHTNYQQAVEMLIDVSAVAQAQNQQESFIAPNTMLLNTLVNQALQASDPAVLSSLLERIATRYLGDKKLWPLYESNRGRNNSYRTPLAEIQNRSSGYLNFVNTVRWQPRQSSIWRFHLANGLENLVIQNNFNQVRLTGNMKNNVEVLTESGLFAPGSGMFLADGSFLPDKCIYFNSSSDDNREQIALGKELLKTEGDNRFWARIIGAAMAKEKSASVVAEITKEMKSITTWSPIQQAHFANWLYAQWPDLADSKLRSWLMPKKTDNLAQHETVIRELPQNIEQLSMNQEEIANHLALIMIADPIKAAKLWVEMMHQCDQLNLASNSSVNNTPLKPHEYLHYAVMQTFQYNKILLQEPTNVMTFLMALQKANIIDPNKNSYQGIIVNCLRNLGNASAKVKISPSLEAHKTTIEGKLAQILLNISTGDQDAIDAVFTGIISAKSSMNGINGKNSAFFLSWITKELAPKNTSVANFARVFFTMNSHAMSRPADRTACTTAFQAILADDKISNATKLALHAGLQNVTNYKFTQDPAILDAVTEMLAHAEVSTDSQIYALQSSLRQFNLLTNDNPKLAAQLCQKVFPYLDAAAKQSPTYRQSYGDNSYVEQWMQATYTANDKELFKHFTLANPDYTQGNLNCLASLLSNGWDDILVEQLPKAGVLYLQPEGLLINGGQSSPTKFTADLEKRLAAFLPTIVDPQQRYRFESVISNLNDATAEKTKPVSARKDRLIALAERFIAEAPPQPQARMELLCFLDSTNVTANLEEMLKLSAPLDLADVVAARFTTNNNVATNLTQQPLIQQALIERTMAASLMKKQPDYFLKQMQNLSTLNSPNNAYQISRVFSSNLAKYSSAILNELIIDGEKKQKIANEFIAICDNAATTFTDSSDSFSSLYLYSLMAHSLSGQGDKFQQWCDGQSPQFTNGIKSNREYYFGTTMKTMNKDFLQDEKKQSTVVAMFTKLLSDEHTNKLLIPHAMQITVIIDNGLLTAEQACEVIGNVPDTCLRKPNYLTERAGIIAWKLKDATTAEKDYLRARELAAELKLPEAAEAAKAFQARMYAENNKRDEAEKLAATVDLSLLTEQDRRFFAPLAKFAKPLPVEKKADPAEEENQ